MSAEFNKILCAILTAILVLLLSSFISELLYHPKKSNGKVSYLIEDTEQKEIESSDAEINEQSIISPEEIEQLLTKANLPAGEKFVIKNCSACHSFELPIKNKVNKLINKVLHHLHLSTVASGQWYVVSLF